MNTGQLQAWAAAHRTELLGAGGVVGVAVVMRSRAKKTAAATAPAIIAPAPATADTSATDTYNALNDNLTAWESTIQAQIDALGTGGNAAPSPAGQPPAPSPGSNIFAAPPSTAPPSPVPVSVPDRNIFFRPVVAPAGVPAYTQAQLDAMTANQRGVVYGGSYTLLPAGASGASPSPLPYVTVQPGADKPAGLYSPSGTYLGPLGSHPIGYS